MSVIDLGLGRPADDYCRTLNSIARACETYAVTPADFLQYAPEAGILGCVSLWRCSYANTTAHRFSR